MDINPDELLAGILAENNKINQINAALSAVKKDLADGDDQLQIAHERLEIDDYGDAFVHSTAAVKHYEMAISSAQEVTKTINSSQDIRQLIKDASNLLLIGEANLMQARSLRFTAEDLMGLQSDVEHDVAAENWILVGLYAGDAVNSYPDSKWFNRYVELAEHKIESKKLQKTPWLNIFFRREL